MPDRASEEKLHHLSIKPVSAHKNFIVDANPLCQFFQRENPLHALVIPNRDQFPPVKTVPIHHPAKTREKRLAYLLEVLKTQLRQRLYRTTERLAPTVVSARSGDPQIDDEIPRALKQGARTI